MTARRFLLLLVLPLVTVGGCGGSDEEEIPADLQSITPSATPTSTPAPASQSPHGFRSVAGDRWKLSFPAAWKDTIQQPTEEGALPVSVITDESQPSGTYVRLAVVPDADPASDVIEQSHVLEVARKAGGAEDVVRSSVEWPGAQRAVVVEWVDSPRGGAGPPESYLTRQMMVQVDKDLIVNVVALAPRDAFAETQLDEAMATLTVEPS